MICSEPQNQENDCKFCVSKTRGSLNQVPSLQAFMNEFIRGHHLLKKADLKDPVRDLEFSKSKAQLLGPDCNNGIY